MNFELDFKILVDDEAVDSTALTANLDQYREKLSDLGAIEGAIVVLLDGTVQETDVSDPILRLVDQWVRKLSWVIGGDTETLALRNSEHCYGFVPTGDSVEFSFFSGTEDEIEEYVVEPTTIHLDAFVTQSLELSQRLLDLASKLDPEAANIHEDCRELRRSLDDGHNAWREYLRNKRR